MVICAPRVVSRSKKTPRLTANIVRNRLVVQNVATWAVLILIEATKAGREQDVIVVRTTKRLMNALGQIESRHWGPVKCVDSSVAVGVAVRRCRGQSWGRFGHEARFDELQWSVRC